MGRKKAIPTATESEVDTSFDFGFNAPALKRGSHAKINDIMKAADKAAEYIGEPPGPNAITDPQMQGLPQPGQIIAGGAGALARMKKTLESKKNGANNARKGIEKRINKATTGEKLTSNAQTASITEKEDTNMAAKKKSSAKSKSARTNGGGNQTTAEPIGRGRKMLLRLSDEEYKDLQRIAKTKEISMAMVLRSSIK